MTLTPKRRGTVRVPPSGQRVQAYLTEPEEVEALLSIKRPGNLSDSAALKRALTEHARWLRLEDALHHAPHTEDGEVMRAARRVSWGVMKALAEHPGLQAAWAALSVDQRVELELEWCMLAHRAITEEG